MIATGALSALLAGGVFFASYDASADKLDKDPAEVASKYEGPTVAKSNKEAAEKGYKKKPAFVGVEKALSKVPDHVKPILKTISEKDLPSDFKLGQKVSEAAQTQEIGQDVTGFEQTFLTDKGMFTVFSMNTEPKIVQTEFSDDKIAITLPDGTKATYLNTGRTQKIEWNEDGNHYLLSANVDKDDDSKQLSSEQLVEVYETLK